MENSTPLIFDISSDDEADFGDERKGAGYGNCGGGQSGDGDDCDWLSELLGQVSGNGKGDFCDDVVLVDEALPNPPKKPRLEPLKPPAKVSGEESDGDDCVVLEGDPDKPTAVAATAKSKADSDGGGGEGDDDLEIIAEKGEVACRDFPHARHLCAKFIFSSTLHQVHCAQCHCYVCDSLAPCPHWGTGISSTDHCHATDKQDYWKNERKRMKNPAPSLPFTSPQPGLYFRAQPVFRPVTSQPVYQVRAHPPFRPVSMSRPPSQLFPVQSRSNVSKMAGLVRGSLPSNYHSQGGFRPSSNPPNRHVLQRRTGTCSVPPVQQINSQSSKSTDLSRRTYFPSQPPVYPQTSYVNTTNLTPLPRNPSVLFRPLGYTPPQIVSSSSQLSAGNNAATPCVQIPMSSKSENTNQPYQSQPQPQSRNYPPSLFDNLPTNFPQLSHTQNAAIDSTTDDFGLAWDSQPQNSNHQQNNVAVADNALLPTNDVGSLHDRMNSFLDGLIYENLPLPLEIPVSPLWNDDYLP